MKNTDKIEVYLKTRLKFLIICISLFLLNTFIISAEPIIDIRLLVYEDDSVIEDQVFLTEGILTQYYQTGNYNLSIYNNNQVLLWNQPLNFYFGGYNGPVKIGVDYSGIYYDSDYLSFRILYDPSMYELRLYHGDKLIFSKILNFCDNDGVCDSSETYESCAVDCPLDENDVICIADEDGFCDPDCGQNVDSDCVEEFYPVAGLDEETFIGEDVSFHGEVTNPGTGTYTYEWFFEDDDSTATGQDVTHVFEEGGVFAVELKVTNQDDVSKTDTLLVTVEATPWHLKKLSLNKLKMLKTGKKCPMLLWWFKDGCRYEHRLDKAIDSLEKSLDRKYWIDDYTLNPKYGGKVFDYEKEAVKELMKIGK